MARATTSLPVAAFAADQHGRTNPGDTPHLLENPTHRATGADEWQIRNHQIHCGLYRFYSRVLHIMFAFWDSLGQWGICPFALSVQG